MCRKHCGKRRKCWLPAFSPFPTMFSKDFFLGVVKSRDCVAKGELLSQVTPSVAEEAPKPAVEKMEEATVTGRPLTPGSASTKEALAKLVNNRMHVSDFYLLPLTPCFDDPDREAFLKTLDEMEKMQVTSICSVSTILAHLQSSLET